MATIQPIRSDRSQVFDHACQQQGAGRQVTRHGLGVGICGRRVARCWALSWLTARLSTGLPAPARMAAHLLNYCKQLGFAAIGIVLYLVLSRLDYGIWNRLSLPAILLSLLRTGCRADIGRLRIRRETDMFGLQPSEPAKIVALMYGATWLASRREQVTSFSVWIDSIRRHCRRRCSSHCNRTGLSVPARSFCSPASAMFFLAGASLLQILLVGGAAGGFAYLMISVFQHALGPLTSFHSPSIYPMGKVRITTSSSRCSRSAKAGSSGMASAQAIRSSGCCRRPHTDSVFAVIAEEMGLLGVAVIARLIRAARLPQLAYRAESRYHIRRLLGDRDHYMDYDADSAEPAGNDGLDAAAWRAGAVSQRRRVIADCCAVGLRHPGEHIARYTEYVPSGEDSDNEGADRTLLGGKPDNSASTTIRRRNSGSRAARTDRSQKSEDDSRGESTSSVETSNSHPGFSRNGPSAATRVRGSVRWRDGRYGTGTGYPRGR